MVSIFPSFQVLLCRFVLNNQGLPYLKDLIAPYPDRALRACLCLLQISKVRAFSFRFSGTFEFGRQTLSVDIELSFLIKHKAIIYQKGDPESSLSYSA